jgi:hypothetical protein
VKKAIAKGNRPTPSPKGMVPRWSQRDLHKTRDARSAFYFHACGHHYRFVLEVRAMDPSRNPG